MQYEQRVNVRGWATVGAVVLALALVPVDLNAAELLLAWDSPTQYEDGTPLTDLAGCRVHYGTASRDYSQVVDLTNALSQCRVTDLGAETTYYFAVTATDGGGRESGFSEELVWRAAPPPDSATFALSAPTAASVYRPGDPLTVSWSGTLPLGSVNVELWRGSNLVSVLTNRMPAGLAEVTWETTVPMTATPSDEYWVYVEDADTPLDSALSELFLMLPPCRNDFDGDGKADIGVYREQSGDWFIKQSSGGRADQNFGWNATVPVPGDYDGDGKTDIAVYWEQTGEWFIKQSSGGRADRNFGWNATIPVPADYDGDGKTDIAVYWETTGDWFIKLSSGGRADQNFGWSETIPVPADYDGDGKTDIAVYWETTGDWFIKLSSGGRADQNFGWNETIPVPGDYDGDGKTDIAVYWETTGDWFIKLSSGGRADQNFGWNETIPVPGDYDGDGKTDIAVYWEKTGNWYIKLSSGGRADLVSGWNAAIPLTAPVGMRGVQ